MTINFIYILIALIACYFTINAYIHTKNKLILAGMIILLFSLIVEIRSTFLGNFIFNATGFFYVGIDAARALLMIYFSNLVYPNKYFTL